MILDQRHSEMTLTAIPNNALGVYSAIVEGRLRVTADDQFQPKAAADGCLQNMT